MKKNIRRFSIFVAVLMLFVTGTLAATNWSNLLSVSVPAAAANWSPIVGNVQRTQNTDKAGFRLNTKGSLTPVYGQMYLHAGNGSKALSSDLRLGGPGQTVKGYVLASQSVVGSYYGARIISSTYEPNRGTITFYFTPNIEN